VVGNGLEWGETRRDWGRTTLQVSMLKSNDFKTNIGVIYHPGLDTDFRVIMSSICLLHNYISKFFRLAILSKKTGKS